MRRIPQIVRRSPIRIVPGLALAAAILLGACGGGESAAGAALADRWLRVGEDLGTGVLVYDSALPPDFAGLLNEGVVLAEGDPELALPVHPDGKLLGSFHLRRSDGSNLIWLIFDVAGNDTAAHDVISAQLDQSPWQVVGGQSSAALSVVRFQSTINGNLDGTAVVQPLPSAAQFALGIERAGSTQELTIVRSAPVPLLEADLVERAGAVTVRRVDGGAVRAAGLQVDDRIVSLAGEPVKTIADVDRALRRLLAAGEQAVSLVYILEVGGTQTPRESTFVPPASRSLPDDFPAGFLIADDMTVLDTSWASQGGQGTAYQVTLLTSADTIALAGNFRDAIAQQGWQITDEQAVGFATQIDFESPDGSIAGRARIDTFGADPSLTGVALQVQRSRASGG